MCTRALLQGLRADHCAGRPGGPSRRKTLPSYLYTDLRGGTRYTNAVAVPWLVAYTIHTAKTLEA